MKLVQGIEGMTGQKSVEFPQGGFTMRKEDHQGLLPLYIWQLKNGQARMQTVVSAGDTSKPPAHTSKK